MSDNETLGLDFQEEFEKAVEGDTVAADAPSSPASEETTVLPDNSEEEQPTVETEGEVSVFGDLTSEKAEGEPPEGDSHKVTVNGETFNVSLSELTDGYQRHADYTRGKQELADVKKEQNNAITLWEALEEDYAGTVQKLMSRTGMKGQVAQKPDQDLETLVDERLKKVLQDDPRLQRLDDEMSVRQIQAIFGELEQEYSLPALTDEDKQFILEKAKEWDTSDLNYVVYRLLQQKEKLADTQKNVDLVSTTSGRRSGNTEDFVPEAKVYATVKDAWEASLAEAEVKPL